MRCIYITCDSRKKQFESCGVYISRVIQESSSFKVVVYMYHVWFKEETVLKLRCLYITCDSRCDSRKNQFLSYGVYILDVIQERTSFKVAVSIYHVWLKVWLKKEPVLKLRCIYIACDSRKKQFESRSVYISRVIQERSILKVAVYICYVWFKKKGVLKLRCIYITCNSRKQQF